jgi:choline dehydrogenase-like flavoprotein
MHPYFQRIQTQIEPPDNVKEALGISYTGMTGTHGPIKASYPQVLDPLREAWVQTSRNLQHHYNPMCGVQVGGFISASAINMERGQRSFAGMEYFKPTKTRSNLHTITNGLVVKIELDATKADAVRATGVTFLHDGQSHTVFAKPEVTLSAGTVGSPQLTSKL